MMAAARRTSSLMHEVWRAVIEELGYHPLAEKRLSEFARAARAEWLSQQKLVSSKMARLEVKSWYW